MENEEVKKVKFGGKKLIVVIVATLAVVIIIVLISIFVLPKQDNKNVDSTSKDSQNLPTTKAEFIPPLIAVESNTPTLYSGKIVFAENIPAKKIFLEILVDPQYVLDILLSLENMDSWTIDDGYYDGENGIAQIELSPSTGLGTSPTKDAIIIIEPTSKDNIQSTEAAISISPNSYITVADGSNIKIEGNTLKLLYPNIAPLVE